MNLRDCVRKAEDMGISWRTAEKVMKDTTQPNQLRVLARAVYQNEMSSRTKPVLLNR